MTQLKAKDKALLFLLLIIGLSVGFYYLLIAPVQTEIKDLKLKEEKLKKSYDLVMKSLNDLNKIDDILLTSKIEAMKISGSVISNQDILKLTRDMENTFLSYTDKGKTTYYASFVGDPKPENADKQPKIKLTEIKETSLKVYEEEDAIKLLSSTMEVKFYTKQKGEDGIKDISGILEKIETQYHYMRLMRLSFLEPNTSSNKEEFYSVSMSVEIYLATGDFSKYAIGTCPHVGDDGTPCMEYNELFYTQCKKCKKDIDNCPNANCHTLLTMDSTRCTNSSCLAQLKQCIECHELILVSDKTCSKCFKPQ